MNNYIEVSGKINKRYKQFAASVAENVLCLMKQPEGLEIAIKFVSRKEIKTINRDFRNIDKVTDVLSFPSTNIKAGEILKLSLPENEMLKTPEGRIHIGDMALCYKQLKSQAKEYGNSNVSELKKLIIHSVLHLLGYDHIKDEDYKIMKKQEEKLEKNISINF